MKAAILAGAVAALLYGTAARAGDCETKVPAGASSGDTQASLSTPERSLDTSASAWV